MTKFKPYRLLWLLPAPFSLYMLWIALAYVFNLATVRDSEINRALAAFIVSSILSLPALFSEANHV